MLFESFAVTNAVISATLHHDIFQQFLYAIFEFEELIAENFRINRLKIKSLPKFLQDWPLVYVRDEIIPPNSGLRGKWRIRVDFAGDESKRNDKKSAW